MQVSIKQGASLSANRASCGNEDKTGFRLTKRRTAQAIAAFLVLACASACTDRVSDDVSLQAVASRGEGIAIMSVQTPRQFADCGSLVMEIRPQDGADSPVRLIQVKSDSDVNGVVQKRLKAGRYAVTNFICHKFNKKVLLQKSPDVFSPDRPHLKYGVFDVARGEVVNIGRIFIVLSDLPLTRLTVSPLTQDHLGWLAQNRPKLSARMVTRLMRPTASP
ncbi:MAG: hypothetical protein AAGF86_03330 [Pseudomonadota bacterium]